MTERNQNKRARLGTLLADLEYVLALGRFEPEWMAEVHEGATRVFREAGFNPEGDDHDHRER